MRRDPMHMSASIQGRWLSLVGRDDRSVTGWKWTVSTGRVWTICLVWSTWKIDVALARVAGGRRQIGRRSGCPASRDPRARLRSADPRHSEGARRVMYLMILKSHPVTDRSW